MKVENGKKEGERERKREGQTNKRIHDAQSLPSSITEVG
jgi:hypothetical protein